MDQAKAVGLLLHLVGGASPGEVYEDGSTFN